MNLPEAPRKAASGHQIVDTGTFRLSIGSRVGDIGKVIDLLDCELGARHVPSELVHRAQTVADELVTNVIRHGFRDSLPHAIDLIVTVGEGGLTLQFSDDGIPFNPCDKPVEDLTRPGGEPKPGGMGIPLVRKLAADCWYTRAGGRNQVTVVLTLGGQP